MTSDSLQNQLVVSTYANLSATAAADILNDRQTISPLKLLAIMKKHKTMQLVLEAMCREEKTKKLI